jgi:signal transduction histidine kinase
MTAFLVVLNLAVTLSFAAVWLLAFRDWLRHRDRPRGTLALAVGLLLATNALGHLNGLTQYRFAGLVEDLTIVAFVASGYALLLFRGTFHPLSPLVNWLAIGLSVFVGGLAILVGLPTSPGQHPTSLQSLVTLALILVWSGMVAEPMVRLWWASRGLPAVQRNRQRALAYGYATFIVILVFAGVASSLASRPVVQLLLGLLSLAAMPVLYASFAPPGWLRRLWREREESAYHAGLQDLLLFSPDRKTLAYRGVDWALRLVGGDAGFIAESGGSLLALRGLSEAEAEELGHMVISPEPARGTVMPLPGNRSAIVIPLPLDTGTGWLVVVSGPFTPVFASDEVFRLSQYAIGITIALDRARVTERMTALERTKSEFLNLASHELRSPLAVIRGYVDLLDQGALGELSPAGKRVIPVLAAKAREMNMMVEQMLEAARLEEGRLDLKPEPVDLTELANEAVELMKPLTDPRQHPLVVDAESRQVRIVADRNRVATILNNLLDNAVKYSPNGGEVRLKVEQQNGVARVSVSDRGIGIPEEQMNRLFTRFGRIVSKESARISGTGLGLYLSREIARKHGGDISVQSAPGAGTTFTLTLPANGPSAAVR